MKRIRNSIVFALCIILALAPMVSANSGPTEWTGTNLTGASFTGEQCPLVVLEEKLTFDISELPLAYWEYRENPERFSAYNASVTARYVFHNPTDADVTATLLFPLGDRPQYGPGSGIDLTKFGVWTDGEKISMELRHSFRDGIPFESDRDTARLRDELAEHDFYFPEQTVTKYIYKLTGAEPLGEGFDTAKLVIGADPGLTKTMVEPARSHSAREHGALVGTALAEDRTVTVWEIGQPTQTPHEWLLHMEGQMELVSVETMTFQELALCRRPVDSQISELDWYNIMVDQMSVSEWPGGFFFDSNQVVSNDGAMPWYRYQLTVPAGETVENIVTAPVYPYMNVAWSPYIYTYRYLLSPAKGWAEFGPLDIEIKTPFHMTQCNLEGFEKTEEGYALHLDGLPDKELEFVLSEKRNPRKPGSGLVRGLLVDVLVVAALITWFLRRKKKKA